MATEISYPFTADSAGGGSQMMSQEQWQMMARIFGKDRVDYRLYSTSLTPADLPFYAAVVNGTSVSIAPGKALVGGFYYQLTATQTVSITPNSGSTGRIDLIVLRANLANSSVNLAVVQGQPAASPKIPALTTNYGGIWEMPLHQVSVPANGGALSLITVAPFDAPDVLASPWNTLNAAYFQPAGTFLVDMDNNNTDTQTEYFVGRDATTPTRDLARTRKYTPTLTDVVNDVPAGNKRGRWRYIAPGVVWFSAQIRNDYEDTGPVLKGTSIGFTLPRPASGYTGQIIKGRLENPYYGGGLPNSVDLTGVVNSSSSAQSTMRIWHPNPTDLSEGLDVLRVLPPRSTMTFSGVYETDTFGN